MFRYIYDKGCYRLAKSLTFDSNLYQFMTISQPPMDQESVAFRFYRADKSGLSVLG